MHKRDLNRLNESIRLWVSRAWCDVREFLLGRKIMEFLWHKVPGIIAVLVSHVQQRLLWNIQCSLHLSPSSLFWWIAFCCTGQRQVRIVGGWIRKYLLLCFGMAWLLVLWWALFSFGILCIFHIFLPCFLCLCSFLSNIHYFLPLTGIFQYLGVSRRFSSGVCFACFLVLQCIRL